MGHCIGRVRLAMNAELGREGIRVGSRVVFVMNPHNGYNENE
jgi:hypothetical protein